MAAGNRLPVLPRYILYLTLTTTSLRHNRPIPPQVRTICFAVCLCCNRHSHWTQPFNVQFCYVEDATDCGLSRTVNWDSSLRIKIFYVRPYLLLIDIIINFSHFVKFSLSMGRGRHKPNLKYAPMTDGILYVEDALFICACFAMCAVHNLPNCPYSTVRETA